MTPEAQGGSGPAADPTPDVGTDPAGAPQGGALVRLLEVQDHDTAIDQLRHRRSSLPELSELAAVEARLAVLGGRMSEARAQRDELGARQADLEQQIDSSRARRSELERRMFGGQVSAARDLQAMDDEVKHLVRRITDLEDREIEVMEALEPVDRDLQVADAERGALDADTDRLRRAIAAAVGAIDADIVVQSAERQKAASGLPGDLLARYERLRSQLGGTGAARLVGGSCSGCHLSLPSMEVDRIRKAPADQVITCDQCGRILVR
jgi:predicted  nucleic acid-binding Zn-ribbon protein